MGLDQTAQSEEGTESGAFDATGGGETEDSTQIDGVQSEGTDNTDSSEESLGDNNLPPELQETKKKLLRDYHAKTQRLADERKALEGKLTDLEKSHNALSELMKDEAFVQWAKAEKARRSGQMTDEDMTDENFDAIRNDKRAFREYLNRYARDIESRVLDKTKNADREVRQLKTELEHEKLSKRYPDFKKVMESGVLDSFKREGYSDETAYALHKLRNSATDDQKVKAEARKVLEDRRAGAVDKQGVTQVRGGERVIKAKNFDDFFDQAMQVASKGDLNFRAEKA